MKNLESEEYYLREWVTKSLVGPDERGYIFKYFKNDGIHKPFSFEKQKDIIEKKKQYIWKFLPETELIRYDGSYCIKQKYIEGKLLKFIDINQLDANVLSDLLELFDWYIAYCKEEWVEIDVIWYQQDIYTLEDMRKRRFLFYTRIFDSFLSSTNIMISNDNKVYMVDVCDTIPEIKRQNMMYKLKSAVRQAILKLWIKKTEYRIRHLISKKRKELCDVLS